MILRWETFLTAQGYFRGFTGGEELGSVSKPFALSWYQEVDGKDDGVYTMNVFCYTDDGFMSSAEGQWVHREIARNWMLA